MSYQMHVKRDEEGRFTVEHYGDVPPGVHEISGHYDPKNPEGNLTVTHRLPGGRVRATAASSHHHVVELPLERPAEGHMTHDPHERPLDHA